jgi:hypothetical protein
MSTLVGTYYSVYCSTCNAEQKRKMSWLKYIKYMTLDGRGKGRHEIDAKYVKGEPSVCPFGHQINPKKTRLIEYYEDKTK